MTESDPSRESVEEGIIELAFDPYEGAWNGDVSPELTGQQTAVGAPGPAGVHVVSGDAVKLSLSVEGRVAALRISSEPSPADMNLLDEFFVNTDNLREQLSGDSDSLQLRARPIADRIAGTQRAARLEGYGRVADKIESRFLWHAEIASLASGDTRAEELARSDDLAPRFPVGDYLWEIERGPLDSRMRLDLVHQIINGLVAVEPLPHGLGVATVQRLRDLEHGLEALGVEKGSRDVIDDSHLGGSVGLLEREAMESQARDFAFDTAGSADEQSDSPSTNRSPTPQTFGLGLYRTTLESKQLSTVGLEPSIEVTRKGNWYVLSGRLYGGVDVNVHRPILWVQARGQDGRLLGVGQFGGRGAILTASVAVAPGAEVSYWQAVADPLIDVAAPPGIAGLVDATRLSRAAWIAYRTERESLSKVMFAAATRRWLRAGLFYRAGWAWSLADQDLVGGLLSDWHAEEYVSALQAVVDTGDVPGSDVLTALPTPLWAYSVDPEGDIAERDQ